MTRLPLLDRTHAPVAAPPADPHGPVIPLEEIDEILRLPMRRRAGDQARIELQRDRESGLWMWATCYALDDGNTFFGGGRCSGYQVGPKWGNFAATRETALHCAISELLSRIETYDTPQTRRIRTWLEGLR